MVASILFTVPVRAEDEEKTEATPEGIIPLERDDIEPSEFPAETTVGVSRQDVPNGWSANQVGVVNTPIPTNAKSTWQFRCLFQKPRSVMLKLPGKAKHELFWFFKFTIINQSGKKQRFDPEVQLYTETGQLMTSDKGFDSKVVYNKVKKILKNPLLTTLNNATGDVLNGEDNAVEVVAIFKDFDPKAASFDLFIGGLSGEMAKIKLPKKINVKKDKAFTATGGKVVEEEETVLTDEIIVTKTLKLTFKIPSQKRDRLQSEIRFVKKEWVMR